MSISSIPTMLDFDVENGAAVLERTPRVLRALLSGLSAAWIDGNEGAETWSPYVNVGHLVHGEKTDWIQRAEIILAQGENRRFTPFDRFAQFRDSAGKSLDDLLDEFERLRTANVATLRGWRLTDAQLALQGEHPAFGPVSLRQLLSTWVAHDLGHIAQISRVMAKQYRDAIGPWRAVSASDGSVGTFPGQRATDAKCSKACIRMIGVKLARFRMVSLSSAAHGSPSEFATQRGVVRRASRRPHHVYRGSGPSRLHLFARCSSANLRTRSIDTSLTVPPSTTQGA